MGALVAVAFSSQYNLFGNAGASHSVKPKELRMLQDIAVLTGGQAISEDLGIKLENVNLSMPLLRAAVPRSGDKRNDTKSIVSISSDRIEVPL